MNQKAAPIRVAAGFLVLVLGLLIGGSLATQNRSVPNYDAFRTFADDVSERLEGDIRINELESLRAQLADRRSAFLAAREINAARIATLRAQIDALGPEPADSEPAENGESAERRTAFSAELDALRQPVIAAEVAYTLADGLVSEIDRTIRDRYAAQLLARGPSPLNPAYWPRAAAFLGKMAGALRAEVDAAWSEPDRRRAAIESLGIAVPLGVIGLLLTFRSRWWIRLLERWAVSHSRRGRGVLAFALSLGQMALPLAGVVLLTAALGLPEVTGPGGETLLGALPLIALPIIVSKWLTQVIFPSEPEDEGPLGLWQSTRERLRFLGGAIGIFVAIIFAVRAMTNVADGSEAAIAVLLFLPRLVLAYLIYRIGCILMRIGLAQGGGSEERGFSGTFLRGLGRLAIVTGVAGAVLAALGYGNATEFLLIPAIETLALSAFLLLLQKLVYDLYALMTGTPEGRTDALAPVLIGFALIVASLPLFALIWGARIADLTEIWSRFRAGFAVGDSRISPVDFLTFVVVFAVGYALTRFVQGTLRTTILPKTRMEIGGRNAVTAGTGYVGILLASLLAITTAGVDLSSLALVAGALSVGIGFGLQNVVSNFVSGIILLIERPISEGDWIAVNGNTGYVRDISVRSTRIETFDRSDVIVPNADLVSNAVTNWTRGNLVGRVIVPVGVAHGTDTELVDRLLREVAEAHPMVILNPPPFIYFREFGTNSLIFEIRAFLRDINFMFNVHSDLNHAIAASFAAHGVEVPLPQREVRMREPAVMRPRSIGEAHDPEARA